jgi:hypothetical protein
VEDLFFIVNSYLSLQLVLRRRVDTCVLYVRFESSMAPKYFVSLAQATFSVKNLDWGNAAAIITWTSGKRSCCPFVCTELYPPFQKPGFGTPVALFSFAASVSNLPDRTVVCVSCAKTDKWIDMHSYVRIIFNGWNVINTDAEGAGPSKLPWGTPALMGL